MIFFLKFPLEPSRGGGEFHTLRVAQYLRGRGHPPQLLTSDPLLFRLFEQAGLPRKRAFAGWEPTSKKTLWRWPITRLVASGLFRPLVKQAAANTVWILQGLTEKLVLTPLAKKRGQKVIWLEHKLPGRWLRDNPLVSRYRRLANQAVVVTVSQFAKREFLLLGIPENNLRVCLPGVRATGKTSRRPANFSVGVLSRLEKEKGIEEFLQTLIPVLRTHTAWRILIGGDGALREELQALITRNGLANQVQLLGFISATDKFWGLVSVLAYPTNAPEAFGLSALEAQTHGIPVIAPRAGALPEIIQNHRSGILLDARSEWREALETLSVGSTYEAFALAARKNGGRFSEENSLAEFEKIVLT